MADGAGLRRRDKRMQVRRVAGKKPGAKGERAARPAAHGRIGSRTGSGTEFGFVKRNNLQETADRIVARSALVLYGDADTGRSGDGDLARWGLSLQKLSLESDDNKTKEQTGEIETHRFRIASSERGKPGKSSESNQGRSAERPAE